MRTIRDNIKDVYNTQVYTQNITGCQVDCLLAHGSHGTWFNGINKKYIKTLFRF